jgi:cyclopropane fatty-acyl-phospholipid synthase-like methyltransferase
MGKDDVTRIWDRAAPTYDRIGPPFFSHFGRRLVELAQIPGGATVLDVATGRGAMLFPAAKRVGLDGYAIGIDLSREMVRETVAEIRCSGLRRTEICRMDGARLAFAGTSFDFVLCGAAPSPNYVPEFYRVLKPDGQAGMTVIVGFEWLADAFRSISPARDTQVNDETDSEDSPSLDWSERLEQMLSETGFRDVQVIEEEAVFVYANEDQWWATMWTLGFRGAIEEMDPATLDRFEVAVCTRIQTFRQPDGIHIPLVCLFALGVKPC